MPRAEKRRAILFELLNQLEKGSRPGCAASRYSNADGSRATTNSRSNQQLLAVEQTGDSLRFAGQRKSVLDLVASDTSSRHGSRSLASRRALRLAAQAGAGFSETVTCDIEGEGDDERAVSRPTIDLCTSAMGGASHVQSICNSEYHQQRAHGHRVGDEELRTDQSDCLRSEGLPDGQGRTTEGATAAAGGSDATERPTTTRHDGGTPAAGILQASARKRTSGTGTGGPGNGVRGAGASAMRRVRLPGGWEDGEIIEVHSGESENESATVSLGNRLRGGCVGGEVGGQVAEALGRLGGRREGEGGERSSVMVSGGRRGGMEPWSDQQQAAGEPRRPSAGGEGIGIDSGDEAAVHSGSSSLQGGCRPCQEPEWDGRAGSAGRERLARGKAAPASGRRGAARVQPRAAMPGDGGGRRLPGSDWRALSERWVGALAVLNSGPVRHQAAGPMLAANRGPPASGGDAVGPATDGAGTGSRQQRQGEGGGAASAGEGNAGTLVLQAERTCTHPQPSMPAQSPARDRRASPTACSRSARAVGSETRPDAVGVWGQLADRWLAAFALLNGGRATSAAVAAAPAAAPGAGASAGGAAGGLDVAWDLQLLDALPFCGRRNRQAGAFLLADSQPGHGGALPGAALPVFCVEVAAVRGGAYFRQFVVASYPSLLQEFFGVDASQRHFYEIVRADRPCHLYCDLEFLREYNPAADPDALVDRLLDLLAGLLHRRFGIRWEECLVVETDSSTDAKFSRHLTLRIAGKAFANNQQVKLVLQQLLALEEARDLLVNKPGPGCGITQTPLLDMAVYSRNRQFRTMWSCKGGKAAVLEPCRGTLAIHNRLREQQPQRWQQLALLQSLASNVPAGAQLLSSPPCQGCLSLSDMAIRPATAEPAATPEAAAVPVEAAADSFGTAAAASDGGCCHAYRMRFLYGARPSQDVQERAAHAATYVQQLAAERASGAPARVLSIAFLGEDCQLVSYCMGGPGSHFCEHIGRPHKSNRVYFILDFAMQRWCQRCYDPDCFGFQSPWRPLPLPPAAFAGPGDGPMHAPGEVLVPAPRGGPAPFL